MKVLLLGSTGYIGRAVMERLLERGHDVVALVRSVHGPTAHPAGVQLVEGDGSDPNAVGDLVISSGVEAAIHAAAIGDWTADRKLVETLATTLGEQHRGYGHGAGPLVYTSGTWMVGPTAGRPAHEQSPTSPIPLVAGREAVEAAALAQDKVRAVVIRPGIVHGRAGGICEMLVAWAREDGVGRYVVDPDDGPAVWPMVHLDDLADLYVLAVEDTGAQGVLHGVAEAAVAVDELAAAAAHAAGVVPGSRPWDLSAAAGEVGWPFAQALALAQHVEAPAARALGWTPSRPRAVDELRARPLPVRPGKFPEVSGPRPHAQRSQNAPVELQDRVIQAALALEGVEAGDSLVSVPGARAFHLRSDLAKGPEASFQAGTEFAHVHPGHDGSLHLTLPAEVAQRMYAAGWATPHPVSGTPLLFGPRDESELELVNASVRASYAYARGWGEDQAAHRRGLGLV